MNTAINEMIQANTGRNPLFVRPFELSFGYASLPSIHSYRGYAGSITEALCMAQHHMMRNALANVCIEEVR